MDSNCIFCTKLQQGDTLLYSGENFYIVGEKFPVVEGTILIIPKEHYSCYGAIPSKIDDEFNKLKIQVKKFLEKEYKKPVIFLEHGIEGQTIKHAHLHCVPLDKSLISTISQKLNKYILINNLSQLRKEFDSLGKYFYYEENEKKYVFEVDSLIPGYLRFLLGDIVGQPERSNWKEANPNLFTKDVKNLLEKWNSDFDR